MSSNLLAALRAMTREMALGTPERHRRWQQVRVRLAAQGFTNISDPETVGVRLSLADWEALLDRLETHP